MNFPMGKRPVGAPNSETAASLFIPPRFRAIARPARNNTAGSRIPIAQADNV